MSENAYHILPANDLKEHESVGVRCWCKPEIKEGGNLIVHNSADGREFYEEEVKGH